MEIRAIETEYKGYLFRSRLEARWAVFFDACGVKWEYEPEGFDLGDGIYYLPDFLLHDVSPYENLWVEVKGVMTTKDAKKIQRFCSFRKGKFANNAVVVGSIPTGNNVEELFRNARELSGIDDETEQTCNIHLFTATFLPDFVSVLPAISVEGEFKFVTGGYRGVFNAKKFDNKATVHSYDLARQARFEHSTTTETHSVEYIKTLLAFIEPSKLSYYNWLTVANILKKEFTNCGIDDSAAFEIFDEWCARDSSVNTKGKPRYNRAKNKKHWDSLSVDNRFNINSLIKTFADA